MTLNEFGRFLQTKSSGRLEPPVNEQLTERVYTGMKRIAKDTLSLKWVVEDKLDNRIFRKLDENTLIRYPKKPILDSGDQLDIEESLLDALALYVLAGLELQRSKVLMGMYREEIDMHEERLIETSLSVATNDAERFYQFP